MSHPLKILCLALLLSAIGCDRAAKEDAAKNIAAAKAAARAYTDALRNGDAAAAEAVSVGGNDEVLAATATLMASVTPFQDALTKKFGPDVFTKNREWFKSVDLLAQSRQQALAEIDGGEVSVKDDTATLAVGKDKDIIKLRKVNGQWKVDLAGASDEHAVLEARETTAQVRQATEDLNAGKFATVDDVRKAMQAK